MKKTIRQTILLVEDETLIATTERTTLEQGGYTVITAGTGARAAEIVRSNDVVDLVLLDIELSQGMCGVDAATAILAERDLPLVFLISDTHHEFLERTKAIASYGYVVRNSGEVALLASTRTALRLFQEHRLADDVFIHSTGGVCIHRLVRDETGVPFDCEYVRVNAAFETHTGLSPLTVTGRTIRDFYTGSEAADVIRLYAAILAGRAESRQEIYSPSFRSWFELIVVPARGDEFAVMVSNITARKETQAIDRRLRAISDAAVFGNAIADTQGNLVYVNRYFARVHGYEPDELTGRHLSCFHTPEQMKAVSRALTSMKAEGYLEPVEIWHVRRDGAEFAMLMSGVVISNDEGEPQYLGVSAIDITELKRAETRIFDANRQLKDALEQVTTIMAAVPTAILVFDRDAWIIEDNPAARSIFSPSKPVNGSARCGDYIRCRHCYVHQEDCGETPHCSDCEINAAIMDVLHGGPGVSEQDKKIVQCDGASLWMRFSVVPLTLQDERCALLLAQDVSSRRRAESEIARQLAEKEILLKEVHHRVKNNIVAITSILTLQAATVGTEEVRAALNEAVSRVRSMGELYKKLLLGEEYRDVSMREYAEGLIGSIREVYAGSFKIVVEMHIADFAVDAKQAEPVGIILTELVMNVFKHAFVGRDGGNLLIAIDKAESTVTITVRDDGVGFGKEAEPTIPSGFGLTLVRILTEQLDGSFSVECDQGTRSVVRFDL